MSILPRIAVAIIAAVGAAFVAAIIIGIYDIYRTGHGQPSIMETVIDRQDMGIAMSIGDLALVCSSLIVGLAVWVVLGRIGR
jgi:hypothetical protein